MALPGVALDEQELELGELADFGGQCGQYAVG
jgi:hypothetical protein